MAISEDGMVILSGREVGFRNSSKHDYAFVIKARLTHEPTENEKDALFKAGEILSDAFLMGAHEVDLDVHKQAAEERASLLKCFGNLALFVDDIPNGYCNRGCCAFKPWFIVTTSIGRIKIGWRKRVIHLEWTDTAVKQTAQELFSDDVTRYERVIHCYGYGKLTEYLAKLFEVAREAESAEQYVAP